MITVEGNLQTLVGLYNIFGRDDKLIGLREEQIVECPDAMFVPDFAPSFTLDVTDLKIIIDKSVEADLIDECN